MSASNRLIKITMEKNVNKKKKVRTQNWSLSEKNLLLRLIKEKIHIIDNKHIDCTTNTLKDEAWKQIWKKFSEANYRPRSLKNIRSKWKNIKSTKLRKKQKKLTNSIPDEDDETVFAEPLTTEDVYLDEECGILDTYIKKDVSNDESPDSPTYTPKKLVAKVHESDNGIDYKKSLLSLNRLVKEQITNCALEEHNIRIKHMEEEHCTKMEMSKELHSLECDNLRLKGQLLELEIEIKRKILNNTNPRDYTVELG